MDLKQNTKDIAKTHSTPAKPIDVNTKPLDVPFYHCGNDFTDDEDWDGSGSGDGPPQMIDGTEKTFYPPESSPKNSEDDKFGYPVVTKDSK